MLFLIVSAVASCDKEDTLDCADVPIDQDGDGSLCDEDCDDDDATVFKKQLYYIDRDGDTFGDINDSGTPFCEGLDPIGYSAVNTDCDDSKAEVNPAAPQGCDGVDTNCDGLSGPPQLIMFTQPGPYCSLDNVNCTAQVDWSFSLSSICEPSEVNILIQVDLNSDGNVDQTIEQSQLTGEFPNYMISERFPFGDHTLRISIENCGCGEQLEVPFVVEDCKAPSPICINGLVVELQPLAPGTDADGDGDFDAGAATISALDFIASPITDCSGPIVYSINFSRDSVDINQSNLILTCDNDETTVVEIYAWDNAGNKDYCETSILVKKEGVPCN